MPTCDDIEDIPMVGKAGNPVKPPTPENAEIKDKVLEQFLLNGSSEWIIFLHMCPCMQWAPF